MSHYRIENHSRRRQRVTDDTYTARNPEEDKKPRYERPIEIKQDYNTNAMNIQDDFLGKMMNEDALKFNHIKIKPQSYVAEVENKYGDRSWNADESN